ncbi:MAG: hypothetical protein WAU68_02615 [Vitreimonas sp.]
MRMISSLVFVAAVLACSPASQSSEKGNAAPAVSTATASTAQADAPVEFQAPSGNIGCDYVPAGGTETYSTPDGGPQLICDRIAPAYVRFTLSAHGAATLIDHVGDAGCCGGDTMQYGTHWTGGPFACDLSEAGITCSNADRRGFTLSRTTASAD